MRLARFMLVCLALSFLLYIPGRAAAQLAPSSHTKQWTPEEGAILWATYIAVSENCSPGVNTALDVIASYSQRGLNFNDFRPNGKYAMPVIAKMQNTQTWLEGMGREQGCKGMRDVLAAYWPEALAGGTPATAGETAGWVGVETQEGYKISYGLDGSFEAVISFECAKGQPKILVYSYIGSKGLQVGQATTLSLSAGGVTKTFKARAEFNEMSRDIDVTGVALWPDVAQLLSAGGALQITVPGKRISVPLQGASASYATFRAACPGRN